MKREINRDRPPAERPTAEVGSDSSAISYLVAFVVAAFVLLLLATSGAEVAVVQAALLAFVAVATLWVRIQYVDALDGSQWVLPGNVAAVMLLGGIGVGVWWILTSLTGTGTLALALFWLSASALITRMRDTRSRGEEGVLRGLFDWTGRRRGRLGILLTGVGLLMTIVGCLLLGSLVGAASIVSLALLGIGLGVLTPVGLALLSEAALSTIQRPDNAFVAPRGGMTQRVWDWLRGRLPSHVKRRLDGLWRRLMRTARPLHLMVGGSLVFVVVAVIGSSAGGTWLLLVLFGALAAVIIALVSSTHADAVILIALVALLGVTPQPDSRLGVTAAKGDAQAPLKTLVAIGDSYLSGEGASTYYANTDDAKKNECRRAPTAWAALVADDAFDAMAFLACSGARSGEVMLPASDPRIPSDQASRRFAEALAERGLIKPQDFGDGLSQLAGWEKLQHERHLAPSLVVVSLGGNDAGFSTIGTMCLAPGSCAAEEQQRLWRGALPQVRDHLRLTYAEIDQMFDGVPVLTVGYPDPVYLSSDECREVSLTSAEKEFLHDFVAGAGGLNAVISQTSAEFGFHYVDSMQESLAGQNLQLCDPGNDNRPGLNFIGLRSVRGAAEHRFNPKNWLHGSLHPNERGHAAMLRAFQTWMAKHAPEGLPPRVPVSVEAQARLEGARADWTRDADTEAARSVDSAPPCDPFAVDDTGCRPQGTQWALGQVRHMLVAQGGLAVLLVAAFAAWCAAVGFFAWRRIVNSAPRARSSSSTIHSPRAGGQ